MAEYDNTNKVKVWKNESEAENAPAFTGFANVDGVEKEVSLWYYPEADGKKAMFSGTIKEKWVNPNADVNAPESAPTTVSVEAPAVAEDLADEIPF